MTVPDYLSAYRGALEWTVILIPLGVFLFSEWRRLLRNRRVIERRWSLRPPYTWPIVVPQPTCRLFQSQEFDQVIQLLRRRRLDDYWLLDLEATIAATVPRPTTSSPTSSERW
jgi:hypothetical protein